MGDIPKHSDTNFNNSSVSSDSSLKATKSTNKNVVTQYKYKRSIVGKRFAKSLRDQYGLDPETEVVLLRWKVVPNRLTLSTNSASGYATEMNGTAYTVDSFTADIVNTGQNSAIFDTQLNVYTDPVGAYDFSSRKGSKKL